MATKKKKTTKRKKKTFEKVITLIVAAIILICGYFTVDKIVEDKTPTYEVPDGVAQFHFIDVCQGDAELITVGTKAVLIDTGDKAGKDALIKYLDDHNVKEIEYFIVTHPDADHFASAAYVLDNYTVKNVIMSHKVKTTKMFETFIATLENHTEINVINAHDNIGQCYYVDDLELKILAPLGESYGSSDTNNYSVVVMARYGNNKVLLTGDAEDKSEEEMVEQYKASDLKCDVLKVGHHGSRTATTDAFLEKVNPTIAVISCGVEDGRADGKDNDYGHPHSETMEKLSAKNITVYITEYRDDEGVAHRQSIVLESDGNTITKK
ncbi:MAG: ComEC/Rec2 family competence protein [Eubacteriales bacterium]